MDWYIADKKYIEYLRKFDNKVQKIEYKDRIKPYIGILIEVNNYNYYVPISSHKKKHNNNMKNNIDFHKIEDEITGELYSVININNMVPIPKKYVTKLKYSDIEKYCNFNSEKDKKTYIYLLQKEKTIIDNLENTLKNKAIKLYNKCKLYPQSSLAQRCCNFILLEQKSIDYDK